MGRPGKPHLVGVPGFLNHPRMTVYHPKMTVYHPKMTVYHPKMTVPDSHSPRAARVFIFGAHPKMTVGTPQNDGPGLPVLGMIF